MNLKPSPQEQNTPLQGHKSSGGSTRAPVEKADNLHSTMRLQVLDLLGEGEIRGLVNGLESVYLNETPVQNPDGTLNFEEVEFDTRNGTQHQSYIPGIPATQSTTSVGTALVHGTPWTRNFSNEDVSAVRITLGTNGLAQRNPETGDTGEAVVEYVIEYRVDDGLWVNALNGRIKGKSMSAYRRSHRINLPAGRNRTLRVTRITSESTSSNLSNATVIDSYTEIVDAKLRHPMSALAYMALSAEQFSSVPSRAYDIYGRIVQVPSNYNPSDRSYSGVWDGTFKPAWTDNPAWVFYDLVTNSRYGAAIRSPGINVNKWDLYTIAAYCDQLVPDGRGGQEPRFTCNIYLQSQAQAFKVLQDFASIFRGVTYWANNTVMVTSDMPKDVSAEYSQANVIDGRFTYTGSRRQHRYTVANVTYSDQSDFGRRKTVYVQDAEGIARYGIRETDIDGFGCTSESQAYRIGQWALLSSKLETSTVGFTVGLEGVKAGPGKIISVADNELAGRRISGRIYAIEATQTWLELELDSQVAANVGDKLLLSDVEGKMVTANIRGVELVDGRTKVSLPLIYPLPVVEGVWSIESSDLAPRLYRVISVTEKPVEGGSLQYEVSAVRHEPGKFDFIDSGTRFEPKPVSVVPSKVLPEPTGITISQFTKVNSDGNREVDLTVNWNKVEGVTTYELQWDRSGDGYISEGRRSVTEVVIPRAVSGTYTFRVRALAPNSSTSAWAYSEPVAVESIVLPVRNYDTFDVFELPNGMRRFSFAYTSIQAPTSLLGAEIRYARSHAAVGWEDMTRFGDSYHPVTFETSLPEAGEWTFALRALSRSHALSEGMLTVRANLVTNAGEQVKDLTPPPEVEGLKAYGAFTTVQVVWDLPDYPQGKGHARTEVWSSFTEDFAAGEKVGESYGGPISFECPLQSTVYVWARNITSDGVAGEWSGYVTATTSEDVEKLLDVVEGKIDESHLKSTLSSRIAAIDISTPELGSSLIEVAQAQAVAQRQTVETLDRISMDALQALLVADQTLARVTAAGVYVDSDTGQVKIHGLEMTSQQLTELQVVVDALTGQINLKATTSYVDGKIAEAVLSPADLILYEGLDGRILDVATRLDSVNGQLQQKASQVEFAQALLRITSAEQELDAVQGQISLRVTKAEYDADQNVLRSRLSSAEIALNTLDAPSIVATVQAVSENSIESEKQAIALLQDIINGENNRAQGEQTLAFVRDELSASIDDGLKAEAQARTTVATQLGQSLSAVQQTLSAYSDQLGSVARDVTAVQSTAGNANAKAESALEAISSTDGKLSSTVSFKVQLNTNGAYHFAGFGLGIESDGKVVQTQFLVTADRFAILPSTTSQSSQSVSPFAVENGKVLIRTAVIGDASITGAKIANATIDSAQITDAAITTAKIGNAQITGAKIADATITTAKIANAAIGSAQISDAAITRAKIANAAIGAAQIEDASITAAKIANATIGSAQISDAAITKAKIANAAIGAAQIENAAITSAKIGNAQVDTLNIAGYAVTVPVSVYNSGTLSSSTEWRTTCSLRLPVGDVQTWFVTFGFSYGLSGSSLAQGKNLYVRVLLDGVEVRASTHIHKVDAFRFDGIIYNLGTHGSFSSGMNVTSGGLLEIQVYSTHGYGTYHRYISAMGTKR